MHPNKWHAAAGAAPVAEEASKDPCKLAGSSVWLSLTVEGTPLSDAGSGGLAAQEPVTDWRLVLGPALLVENLLPVRGNFLVWEQTQVRPLPRPVSCMFALCLCCCLWVAVSVWQCVPLRVLPRSTEQPGIWQASCLATGRLHAAQPCSDRHMLTCINCQAHRSTGHNASLCRAALWP